MAGDDVPFSNAIGEEPHQAGADVFPPYETDPYETDPHELEAHGFAPYELDAAEAPPLPAGAGQVTREPPRRRVRVEPMPPDDLTYPTILRPPAAADRQEPTEIDSSRWLDALFDPGRRSIGAFVLVGLAAACIAGLSLWRSRPEVVTAAPDRAAHAVASPRPSSPSPLVVDVSGKVRHPGVVRLPEGSRVADAVKAAGGTRHGVDTPQLNLARKVVDGEQILVGVTPPGAASGGAGARVDINTASTDQLEELPEIGPVLAGRIVEYRQDHGGFRSVDELKDVSGIGEKTYAELEDKVRV